MFDVSLFAEPKFPAGIPSTPAHNIARDKQMKAEQNQPGHFEHDAFEYSGKRSQPFLPTPTALDPVVTTVLSAEVKEDDSHQAYESMTGVLSTAGSAATQLMAAAAPVAGMAAMGFTTLRNAVPTKGSKEV